jgi:hypothetical protein
MSMNRFTCMANVKVEKVRRSSLVENGKVVQIVYSSVKGRRPLSKSELENFQTVTARYAEEIVQKWIDYFVLHKPIEAHKITQRIR